MTNQEKVLQIANTQMGIKEYTNGSNKQIEAYHRFSTLNNDTKATDNVSWCSSFMCYCFESAGLESTNSKLARSWLKYGKETKEPMKGDIVVFWRESRNGYKGHVGLFVGFTKSGNILVKGGNQSDSVCVKTYSKEQLLGFRTY